MNDQHDDRHRGAEPQWPTGEDPDGGAHPPRHGAGDQPERPNTSPGGFARPEGPPRHGTPPGGFSRPGAGGPPPGGRPPGTPPGGIPQGPGTPPGGLPQGGPPHGTPPGGIPQGGRRHAPEPGGRPGGPPADGRRGGPGVPGPGVPGGPGARPGPHGPGAPGPGTPGHGVPGAANADPNATRQVPRPATPPGGLRRPPGPNGPVPPGRPPAGGPGGARRPGEEPTDLLPPVHQTVAREPELLTHREDELPVEPVYDDDYADEPSEQEVKALRRKKVWRRVRRISYVGMFLMILAPVVAFAIAYQVVDVPNPEKVAFDQAKAVTILYSDESVMTKIAPVGANRTLVKYDDLPEQVKRAVFAAEDPTFETNPGFDFRAIGRAVWYQLTNRDSGGSGLTQQYVKQATEDDSTTLSRKFNEVVKAYKMSEQQDKRDILTAYLNTIYFGRSAYGIKEAAKVYFNKDNLHDLTQSEAALIAGMIQSPSRSEEAAYRDERWNYVMDQLLKHKWIDQSYRDAEKLPPPRPLAETVENGLDGPRLLIRLQIEAELAKNKWDSEKIQRAGAIVHTTIDPRMQTAAEEAVNEVMEGQPDVLRTSMSAIEPGTGAVRAYWGGDGNGIDYQLGTLQEPGSSFKPFDFVAALQKGEGAGKLYDGSSPRTFPGRGENNPVRNSPGVKCDNPKHCSVREAMVKSVNTVFFDMAIQLGTGKVAEAAFQAGIPRQIQMDGKTRPLLVSESGGQPDGNISIGGGQTLVRPFDMTSTYATFAARGVYHEPYFVSKITDAAGEPLYTHTDVTRSAFDPDPKKSQDIADNVTDVLKAIPSGKIACAEKRECAGKTGTHELANSTKNAKAWMVGYTPTLAAGVWVGTDAGNIALVDKDGDDIYGSGVPGKIWKTFMDKAMAGAPMDKFPKPNPIGQLEAPKITTTVPTTTVPKDEDEEDDKDNRTTTTTPTRPTRDETTAPTTPTTKPCVGLRCQTTTVPTDPPDPNPINGNPPTR
ncbi:transglycosylase domain-containing protein [Saccharothrix australiensis]|uniref:Membrane peptidoglycan carboxypeptidase n=1 Tax=Saccharothrix australiensis TaxID=2072 RepID=A0A495VQT8_9PSEU|nr:transglycosylase domain-containing protein [Saccharothrix australiensis]RKT51759.1 membrane peptidoglycan carboxypeptidase [Saccharothrix australiensis]